jgi:hypothetical protein
MPRTRKTFDERIGLLSGKRSEISTRIETLRNRQNGEQRKLDTRRKIIGGGLVFAEAKDDPDFAKILYARFERRLAARDKGMFIELMQEWRGLSGGDAVPATRPLRPDTIREDTGRNLPHKRPDRSPGL